MTKKIIYTTISLMAVTALLSSVGIEQLTDSFRKLNSYALLIAVAIFAANVLIIAWRMQLLIAWIGSKIEWQAVLKSCISGQLASFLMVSIVGNVLGRQRVLARHGIKPATTAVMTVIERSALLLVAGGMSAASAYWMFGSHSVEVFLQAAPLWEMLVAITLALTATVVHQQRFIKTGALSNLVNWKNAHYVVILLVLTVLSQMLTLGAFILLAQSTYPQSELPCVLAASSLTSFAAGLPISINGWGVRELTASIVFPRCGIKTADAIAISIAVGVVSTTAVLLLAPTLLLKDGFSKVILAEGQRSTSSDPRQYSIDKLAGAGIVFAVPILLFFQIPIDLPTSRLNVGFADAFALLAFVVVLLNAVESKSWPVWRIPRLNLLIASITAMLVLGFFNGLRTIGWTDWAFAGRILGWVVILGYLSVGLLAVSSLRKQVVHRLIEVLVLSACCVVVVSASVRMAAAFGFLDSARIPPNFQGYTGNRNSFALQLLIIFYLSLFAFSYRKPTTPGFDRSAYVSGLHRAVVSIPLWLWSSILLFGVFLTSSRAAILAFAVAGAVSFFLFRECATRLLASVFAACLLYCIYVYGIPSLVVFFYPDLAAINVASAVSLGTSNEERWLTIAKAVELWGTSPVYGAGLGVFYAQSTAWHRDPIVVHSTPFWILAEFGLVGLLLYLGCLGRLFAVVFGRFPASRYVKVFALLVIVFFVVGLFHDIFYQRIFWLSMGICLAAAGSTAKRVQWKS